MINEEPRIGKPFARLFDVTHAEHVVVAASHAHQTGLVFALPSALASDIISGGMLLSAWVLPRTKHRESFSDITLL